MHRVPKLRRVRSYKRTSGEQRVALSDIVNLTVPDTKKPKSNALQSAACCQLSQQMGSAHVSKFKIFCNKINAFSSFFLVSDTPVRLDLVL